jgi:hypothetical protein
MDSSCLLSSELYGFDYRLLQVSVCLTWQVHVDFLVMICRGDERFMLADDDEFGPAGYLNDLSLQHRLSRITNSQNILSFEPYLLGHQVFDQAATSAGLWIEDTEDLDLLVAWTHVWPGSPLLSVLASLFYMLFCQGLCLL